MHNDRSMMLQRHHTHDHHYLSSTPEFRHTARTHGHEADVYSARDRALAGAVAPVARKAVVGVASAVGGVNDGSGVENAARVLRASGTPSALREVLVRVISSSAWALAVRVGLPGIDS